MREDGYRQQAPNAGNGVHRNGAAGVVYPKMQLKPFHGVGHERAGNRADHNCRKRCDECAGGAAGDEPSHPAVRADGDIRPAEAEARNGDRNKKSGAGGEGGIDRDQQNSRGGGAGKQDRPRRVEAKPSEQSQKGEKQNANGREMADFLIKKNKVKKMLYIRLYDNSQQELAKK